MRGGYAQYWGANKLENALGAPRAASRREATYQLIAAIVTRARDCTGYQEDEEQCSRQELTEHTKNIWTLSPDMLTCGRPTVLAASDLFPFMRADDPSRDFTDKIGVSVVVPCFNYARFLGRAVDSALSQSVRPLEIIIVDDGSTDETPCIAQEYANRESCVRYLRQENAGLPAARNSGIAKALYDYVAFLDADDEWQPEFLARCTEAIIKLPDDFGLVASRFSFMDRDGAALPLRRLPPAASAEVTCADLVIKTRFFPSAVLAKKEVFSRCGTFDVSLRSSEDREMWIRVAARYRLWLLEEALVRIRRHPDNMSKNAARMKANVFRVLTKSYKSGLVPRWRCDVWLRAFSIFHFQNAWRSCDQGEHGEAVWQLILSLLLWPWFPKPATLNEPVFFRLRGLRTFLLGYRARRGSSI